MTSSSGNGVDGSVRDILTDDVVAAFGRPTEEARGLPNEAFTSEAFFELERRTLFPRAWVFAGLVSDIAEKGDARPVDVAGRSLILSHSQDDEIHAFFNVCPHRGARLLTEPVSRQPVMTCPYHAWTYGMDGQLRNRPNYDGPDRHNDGRNAGGERPCLFPVRCATWHDWIFVNLDGKAVAFKDYIVGGADRFDGYDLDVFRCAHRMSFSFGCNWKLAVENYCDNYHVFKVHPALHDAMSWDEQSRRPMDIAGRHLSTEYWFKNVEEGQLGNKSGVGLPKPPGLAPELHGRMVYTAMFPNVAINAYPANVQLVLFEPISAGETNMHMWFYFVGDAAEAPEFEEARETLYADWANLNFEDEDICRRLQEGRHCDAYDGGRLAPYWDSGTAHYHQQIADAMRGEGAFANSA